LYRKTASDAFSALSSEIWMFERYSSSGASATSARFFAWTSSPRVGRVVRHTHHAGESVTLSIEPHADVDEGDLPGEEQFEDLLPCRALVHTDEGERDALQLGVARGVDELRLDAQPVAEVRVALRVDLGLRLAQLSLVEQAARRPVGVVNMKDITIEGADLLTGVFTMKSRRYAPVPPSPMIAMTSALSLFARSPISARLVRVSWNLNTEPVVTSLSMLKVSGEASG
jgi:hypothetical protein